MKFLNVLVSLSLVGFCITSNAKNGKNPSVRLLTSHYDIENFSAEFTLPENGEFVELSEVDSLNLKQANLFIRSITLKQFRFSKESGPIISKLVDKIVTHNTEYFTTLLTNATNTNLDLIKNTSDNSEQVKKLTDEVFTLAQYAVTSKTPMKTFKECILACETTIKSYFGHIDDALEQKLIKVFENINLSNLSNGSNVDIKELSKIVDNGVSVIYYGWKLLFQYSLFNNIIKTKEPCTVTWSKKINYDSFFKYFDGHMSSAFMNVKNSENSIKDPTDAFFSYIIGLVGTEYYIEFNKCEFQLTPCYEMKFEYEFYKKSADVKVIKFDSTRLKDDSKIVKST